MVNVYSRTVTFLDVALVPQSLADFVVAIDYGDAESAAITTPGGATEVQIVNISRVQTNVEVTAVALAELNL